MREFEKLIFLNETKINYLVSKNQSASANLVIREILQDETCFFKMKKQDALMILDEIGIHKEKIEIIYDILIQKKIFYELLNSGKIKIDDNLFVKYEEYKPEKLFKKKK